MTTSLVIPVKDNVKHNRKDLIYAIRSFEKHLNTELDIFVIGRNIIQLKGLKYIFCSDESSAKWKERNIYRKILAACKDHRVSDNFIFANDDHFLRSDFDAQNLPYYHKGDLSETMQRAKQGDYRTSIARTRRFLMENNYTTYDFDTHFPIIYNKEKFIDTFVCNPDIDWSKEYGYVIKSLYGNINSVTPEFGGDCKIQHKMNLNEIEAKVGGRNFFSTSDHCFNDDMIKFLNDQYSTKSKYEK